MRDRRFSDRSLNVRLPPRLQAALDRACEQQEITTSEFVRAALREALAADRVAADLDPHGGQP